MQPSGVLGLDGFTTVFRADLVGRMGADTIDELAERAIDSGIGLLVIDTLGKLARLENENDNSEWARAMEPLQNAAHRGLAILVLRHERKGGGEVGESGRGGSAASGDVDVILAIRRPQGNQPSNRRVLESVGRYRETPDELVIELDESANEYVVLGDRDAVTLGDCVKAVRAADLVGQKRIDEWAELTSHARSTVQRAFNEGMQAGWCQRSGTGRRGDPYLFEVTPSGTEYVSAQPSLTVGSTNTNVEDDYPASAWDPAA
jgi:hypothetical protein